MKPLEMAARFAAFTWYTDHCDYRASRATVQAEARRFAKESWRAFLPVANEGWGRLLLRVARLRPASQRHRKTVTQLSRRKIAVTI